MATNFPTSLDSFTTKVDNVDQVLAAHINDVQDAIEALETKVGVDNSSDTSSIDYFLRHSSGAFRTHKHDGTSDDGSSNIGPLTGLTIANNVDVGDYQIRAKQFYADVPTGTAPFVVDSTTVVSNLNADKLDGQDGSYYTNVSNVNAGTLGLAYGGLGSDRSADVQGSILYHDGTKYVALAPGTSGQFLKTQGSGANPTWDNVLADGAVSQAKLKSAIGEVSWSFTNIGYAELILPGGEYGLYAQRRFYSYKNSYDDTGDNFATVIWGLGKARWKYNAPGWGVGYIVDSGYQTVIRIECTQRTTTTSNITTTGYAKQRYITSSGKDHWIFLLVAKQDILDEKGNLLHKKGDIIASYQAPDHPSANQGEATPEDIPHPFGSYDPEKHEIIIVDNSVLLEAKQRVTRKRSLLTVINEDFLIDDYKRPRYKPREIIKINEFPDDPIGKPIAKIKTPQWAKIVIQPEEIALEQIIVEKLPDYIKFKKMVPKDYKAKGVVVNGNANK